MARIELLYWEGCPSHPEARAMLEQVVADRGLDVELELRVRCRQTNNEGEYVEWLHEVLDLADGVVLNPAAWTHYSYAIRDAVELLEVPIVEVHLSNVEEREEWRRFSVIADLASKRIIGKGPDGYREALEFLAASQ